MRKLQILLIINIAKFLDKKLLTPKLIKMNATYSQIEKALNNSFEFGIDGDQNKYEAINLYFYEAVEKAGIKKTQEYFTKSDWKAIYKIIKKLIK